MKITPILCVLSLSLLASMSFAGGRYANPPVGLLEVTDACTKGLDAAQKKDTAAALEQAKIGRKVALASYKELSTMPMEVGSSDMKKAIAALEAGKVDEAVPLFEHCKNKMQEEIAYYKKEGKL
ncbi:MAG: hypothetical protein PHE55_21520 [Methylococcaceae bacterium]|nr:hypothetical protein [Methylococcaceae bacterium]